MCCPHAVALAAVVALVVLAVAALRGHWYHGALNHALGCCSCGKKQHFFGAFAATPAMMKTIYKHTDGTIFNAGSYL